MRFRKKPVVINAVQWTGNNQSEIEEFCPAIRYAEAAHGNPVIETLEGFHTASVGDWIIKGVEGEFYSCRPDIFAATYEPA